MNLVRTPSKSVLMFNLSPRIRRLMNYTDSFPTSTFRGKSVPTPSFTEGQKRTALANSTGRSTRAHGLLQPLLHPTPPWPALPALKPPCLLYGNPSSISKFTLAPLIYSFHLYIQALCKFRPKQLFPS